MKGNPKVVSALNQVLTVELTAINQYFLHARMFKNWGLEELNEKAYKKSILDMKQADKVIERILFLEGLPNLQQLNKLRIGEHTEEMIDCDMTLQMEEIDLLTQHIALCEAEQDYVSRELLEELLEKEQDYVDWIEAQQFLISQVGIENYQQSMMED
ncbi:bacterioferritin [Shewanella waksmanii]|uniref:bacterioferritin n=1 Tax=Shewanella waksmanii TaxID=213783 RepID=UPI003734EABD